MDKQLLKTIRFEEILQWDVKQFYITKISSKFRIDKLGNHIIHETKKYQLSNEPDKDFNILGVSNKEGMYDAYTLKGREIKQKYHKVENDWLVYNPYRINVGSIGLKTKDLKGEYISPAYVVFSCKETVLPEYIFFLIKTDTFNKLINDSTTGTVRQTLHFEKIAEINIPVPTIKEQKEILKEYNDTLMEIEKLKEKLHIIERKKDTYLLDVLDIVDVEIADKNDCLNILKIKSFTELLNWDAKGFDSKYRPEELFKSKKYENARMLSLCEMNPLTTFKEICNDEVTFVPMDDVSAKYGILEKKEVKNANFSKGYTRFKENDILWAKITPCMQNGKCFIARDLKNGYGYGSTEFNVFRVNDNVLPEYLFIFLRSKKLRSMAEHFLTGTAGQQRVSKKFFERLYIPIVEKLKNRESDITQETIVNHYNSLNEEFKNISMKIDNMYQSLNMRFEESIYY